VRRGENLQTAFIATEDMMISDPKLFGEQRPHTMIMVMAHSTHLMAAVPPGS